MPHVLVVDGNAESRAELVELIEQAALSTVAVESIEQAAQEIPRRRPHLILVDAKLPDGSGFDLPFHLRLRRPPVVVIMHEGEAVSDLLNETRSRCLRAMPKPIDPRDLRRMLRVIVQAERKRANRRRRKQRERFGPMLGECQAMQRVYTMIEKVAPTDATCLVVGPSGTGKELVAQAIHEKSERKGKPFITLNCGAIPETLIESELFGHVKGAFTGAQRARAGVFERADGGTLFLDEITEMSADAQVRLLRVLESGALTRVGGDKQMQVNVRVIAATNRNLDEAVGEGRFREDLLYRLSVFPIELPPLCERGDDVVLIAEHFLNVLNREHETEKHLSEAAVERLRQYHWPGNVRQLQNVLQRSFIMAGERIDLNYLTRLMKEDAQRAANGHNAPLDGDDDNVHVEIGTTISDAERQLILATLEEYGGDKKKTAEILGISLKTLYNRLKQYGEHASTRGNGSDAAPAAAGD